MIEIGKVTNTHGIKGEIRIKSNFKYKDQIFIKGNKLIILKDELTINTYRVHKEYDMVTFNDINNINDVLKYKGKYVYVNENDYNFGLLPKDIIGMKVYDGNLEIGYVEDILENNLYEILKINKNNKKILIPYLEEFTTIKDGKIYIKKIEGLLDEN